MPSDDAPVTINQVQQATPSDKSTEQNPVITPANFTRFFNTSWSMTNPLVSTGLTPPYLAEILQLVKYDEKIKPP